MNNVIIGTAGHVDHGKTTLINALTGIDTDRLMEEKKRGITIELGFAYLETSDGTKLGIVDVPGHEKFIKNMLAGAGGIDIALLVVAADEGFMPQTFEHFEILKLLNIHQGIIAVTKSDLVDDDWLEAVIDDIKQNVQNSFLENALIIPVSAKANKGIMDLKNALINCSKQAKEKSIYNQFRLPIDRVFSMQGHGTIVTGTLIEGIINIDETVQIYPSNIKAKIRGIQVHGSKVNIAYAGQRVAINISGIKKDDLEKGHVIAKENSMENTYIVDANVQMINNTSRQIKTGDTVHFHHGASILLAKAIILGKDTISKGEEALVQFRFSEPIALKAKDRCVLRFYSPAETIAGGEIINANANKHRRFNKDIIESLKAKQSGINRNIVYEVINLNKLDLKPINELKFSLDSETISIEINKLLEINQIIECNKQYYISQDTYDYYSNKLKLLLADFHKNHPLLQGMSIHDAKIRIFPKIKINASNAVFNEVIGSKQFKVINEIISLASNEVVYTKEQQAIKNNIISTYKNAGIEAPTIGDIANNKGRQKPIYLAVISALVAHGQLIQINGEFMLDADTYNRILTTAQQKWLKTDKFTLAEFRDFLNTSRKYVLLLLDYWDSKRITKKIDDYRIWI